MTDLEAIRNGDVAAISALAKIDPEFEAVCYTTYLSYLSTIAHLSSR
jgi:hypothetical protein